MNSKKLLIDSHVLIWLLYEPEKITTKAKELIHSAEIVYISVISLWELSLKFSKGKLAYTPEHFIEGVQALNIEKLPLRESHILASLDIQLPQKDPFDVILVAQSETEDCIFLTADKNILESKYRTAAC